MDLEHKNNGEKIGFGSKTEAFLRQKSRQAVEVYSDTSLLYLEVDYPRSKRNFYGEILIKEWVDPNGVQLYGNIEIVENSQTETERVPFKLLELKFSCYVEQLKEKGVMPQLGNYFATKNQIFYIHDKTLLDANKHSINTDNEAISIQFTCMQADDETLFASINGFKKENTANEILGRDQRIDGVYL